MKLDFIFLQSSFLRSSLYPALSFPFPTLPQLIFKTFLHVFYTYSWQKSSSKCRVYANSCGRTYSSLIIFLFCHFCKKKTTWNETQLQQLARSSATKCKIANYDCKMTTWNDWIPESQNDKWKHDCPLFNPIARSSYIIPNSKRTWAESISFLNHRTGSSRIWNSPSKSCLFR